MKVMRMLERGQIVIRKADNPARLILFPITSQEPDDSRIALAFSHIEWKRAGLAHPNVDIFCF